MRYKFKQIYRQSEIIHRIIDIDHMKICILRSYRRYSLAPFMESMRDVTMAAYDFEEQVSDKNRRRARLHSVIRFGWERHVVIASFQSFMSLGRAIPLDPLM